MAKQKLPPIGFGRNPHNDDEADQPDGADKAQVPARAPKAQPVFVDDLEALQILTAYNIFPLTPLSGMERQLLQVIAGLELRVTELE